jgi:hypothetical protein
MLAVSSSHILIQHSVSEFSVEGLKLEKTETEGSAHFPPNSRIPSRNVKRPVFRTVLLYQFTVQVQVVARIQNSALTWRVVNE